jgi:hypothetical protein
MQANAATYALMYFVLPLWLAAGFADYLCHRRAAIAVRSGAKESLIHLLLFGEMAVPVLGAIFFEIDALVIAAMIAAFLLHEATALWDVSYATATREVTQIEQHVHSFLEMMPLTALVLVVILHWPQFAALFGLGTESARFALVLKQPPLPWLYVGVIFAAILLFEVLPYIEELVRGLRANGGHLTPQGPQRAAERCPTPVLGARTPRGA